MADLHGNDPVEFDNATADALSTALNGAAESIEGQAGSRQSYVTTASQEFRGHFSELFAQNASTAASDGSTIAANLRTVAGWVDKMKAAAERENARRKEARDWEAEYGDRNFFEWVHDKVAGAPVPPTVHHEDAPTFDQATGPSTPRQTPNPGSGGGGGGGTSSAKPADLRSFATGSSTLNQSLDGKPAGVRGKLTDFASKCSWGHIDATSLVNAFEQWITANGQDVTWANTIADAFAAAGGEGAVSTVSDAALAAALAAAGVSQSRTDLQFDPPSAYGAQPTTGYSMDPVNTSTGNFLEPELDLGFTGASAALQVTRMYNSLDQHVGLFGPGWASILETRLLIDDEGASFVGADGRQVRFPRDGEGWARGVGENRWLAAEGDRLVVRDNQGGRIDFSPSGQWLGQRGGAGTAVRIERNSDDVVVRLVHERGRSIDVDHVDGRVTVLRASDGRRVEYGYDDRGRLVTVTDAVGTRTYGWNDDDLIMTVTSAAGVVEVDNTYDDQRRVVEQVSPHGRTVRFAYLPGRVTVVSDHDGSRSNSYIADAKGRLVGVIDSDDRRQSMSYDRHGNLVSATERDGSVTVHAYDDRGRKTRTVTPSGGDLTYGYDEQDRVTTVVTEAGAVVSYEYVGDDRDPSVITDPVGGRTELSWRDGALTHVVDPTGVVLTFDHDTFGELVATTNAVGATARIERDAAGHPVAAVSPSGARSEYRYDAAGLLVERRDADGAVWRFEYGACSRIAAVVDPLGARTTLDYAPNGELATTTDPLGRRVSRTFDDQGNLAELALPGGAVWTFAHDALSRLQAVTDPAGATWRREYDVVGELTATIDPTGVRQEFSDDVATGVATLRDAFDSATVRFDEYGRPVESSSDETGSELVTYDAAGRPVELVDGEGGLTRLERDLAGRVVALVAPSGARSTYEYDACGRPAAATDAAGARTTLTYDADSRVVARTLPTDEVEEITYDAVGRVVTQTTPGSGTARFRYDQAGRLVSSHDARFGRRRFRYDPAGQLIQVVNGLDGVTSFEYDERGRLVTITDPAGGTTRREYDAADRVVAVTDPLGRTTTAAYDAAGRQVRQTDAEGRTTEWTYDAAGRQRAVLVDGAVQSEISRDAVHRTVVVSDHTRGAGRTIEHELQHDRRGLLVRRARGDRSVAWEYDADGNRTARVDPNGTRTTYRRDAVGRVVGVERDGAPAGTFSYDASGRIVQAATGDLVQSWSYEDGALIAHTSTTLDGAATTRIERDADARITAVDGPSGVVSYEYDAAGQLVRAGDSTWTYDDRGRLVAETVGGVETRHEYDAAGQLVATITEAGRIEYVHDGLGRRIRRTAADGSTTEYAWSDLGYLAAVVDRDASYAETGRLDVWVDALGELTEVAGVAAWWDSAAVVPSLISIADTSLLDLPGGVTAIGDVVTEPAWRSARATDAADPWAALAAVTDVGLPAGVSLTGSGGVSVAGLEWLGARVYDPAARGFLSVDPLAPILGAAWSGNPYSYAGNDPLQAVDPLGLRPATDKDLQAYRDANQGAIAAVGSWWDDNWEYVVAGVAIAGGIALMCTGVGGPAGVALLAASGALMSGGISVATQKATKGEVDWRAAGVDAVVGAVGGAAGGGAALGLGRLAPNVARVAVPGAERLAGTLLSSTGRSALSAGAAGSASNMTDYAFNGKDRTVGGFIQTGATGFATGAAVSVGSSRLGGWVADSFSPTGGRHVMLPEPSGRHVFVPEHAVRGSTAVWNTITSETIDRSAGAGGAVLNDVLTGKDPGDYLKDAINGAVSGAGGPTVGLHSR
ncbi:MAG: type IV secretion protein Rhs [Leifsonia xyli]|nr:MAG: type IV secretion protein Rhs [Leifsonia xyli]